MVANVTESDSPLFTVGQPVEARVMAYPGRTFVGTISALGTAWTRTPTGSWFDARLRIPQTSCVPACSQPSRSRSRRRWSRRPFPMNGVVRNGDGTMAAWVTTDRQRFFQRIIRIGLQQDGQVPGSRRLATRGTRRNRWGCVPQQHAVRPAVRLSPVNGHGSCSSPSLHSASAAARLWCLRCWRSPPPGSSPSGNSTSRPIPNPTPVILEITAQAPGLSAEEMERYYTIPMEIGLYTTPGIEVIRSTSFYGLSFIRVVFKWGVDYDFAYRAGGHCPPTECHPAGRADSADPTRTAGPARFIATRSTGPKHFGLTNLRTVQDWIVLRRLSTIPGIVSINSWGGTTKEFDVEVDPAQTGSLQRHGAADARPRWATPTSTSAGGKSASASSPSTSAASA